VTRATSTPASRQGVKVHVAVNVNLDVKDDVNHDVDEGAS
jgi:hypothetical protein